MLNPDSSVPVAIHDVIAAVNRLAPASLLPGTQLRRNAAGAAGPGGGEGEDHPLDVIAWHLAHHKASEGMGVAPH